VLDQEKETHLDVSVLQFALREWDARKSLPFDGQRDNRLTAGVRHTLSLERIRNVLGLFVGGQGQSDSSSLDDFPIDPFGDHFRTVTAGKHVLHLYSAFYDDRLGEDEARVRINAAAPFKWKPSPAANEAK